MTTMAVLATGRQLQRVSDPKALHRAAAAEFVRAAAEAVRDQGRFTVALSGGSTPKGAYELLAGDPVLRAQVPWDKTQFFWGDERHVPPDHTDSNYRMAREAMLSKVDVDSRQVWRMAGERPEAGVAASDYERTLRECFRLAAGELPRFDLILLGMGPDGHTASLFPGTKALQESGRLAVANWVGKLYTDRITLTAPVLNNAALVMFLVQGEDKAPALKGVLEGPFEPDQLPSQLIRPSHGRLLWLVDQTAGSMLKPA